MARFYSNKMSYAETRWIVNMADALAICLSPGGDPAGAKFKVRFLIAQIMSETKIDEIQTLENDLIPMIDSHFGQPLPLPEFSDNISSNK